MPRCMPRSQSLSLVLLTLLSGCTGAASEPARTAPSREPITAEPFASTYRPLPSTPTLIVNATILTGTGARLESASLLMAQRRIVEVGHHLAAPGNATIIDAAGRWVTPGIIDVHSHLGVYPAPQVAAHADGNELSEPITANVRAEHGVWPQDPGFVAALAGGVTTLQILPGSGNLIGGRSVTLKNVPARTVQAMKFPGAPAGLKMACGENPKRNYGARTTAPMSRMGNVAGYRQAWADALDYIEQWKKYEREGGTPPKRDLELETLAGVLRGEILVHNHCYRADEMVVMLDVAREFGYRVGTFHHAVESYKITEELREAGTCSAMWADWWGFKMEAWDGIRENVAFVDRAGACAIVHSDSAIGIQRLNQEAAKAMAAGRRAGFDIAPEDAIRWITSNAARSLGIEAETGTLEAGKMADVVLWSDDPFSVYTRADVVFIDGARIFDRSDPSRQPVSDFELGVLAAGSTAP